MTVETDNKGIILMHIERFVCYDDGTTVEEKKFFDYTLACEWRRHVMQMLEDEGRAYMHEADSEWVREGGWRLCGSEAYDPDHVFGEVIPDDRHDDESVPADWDGEAEFAREYALMETEL